MQSGKIDRRSPTRVQKRRKSAVVGVGLRCNQQRFGMNAPLKLYLQFMCGCRSTAM